MLSWKILQPAEVTLEEWLLPYLLFMERLYTEALCLVSEKSNLRKEGLFCLQFKGIVLHGGSKNMGQLVTLYSQEAEGDDLCCSLRFVCLHHLEPQLIGIVPPGFRIGLLCSVKTSWKHTHSSTEECFHGDSEFSQVDSD